MEQTQRNRIGYIDALRGMAMILVVYFHIAAYGFGSYELGYNDIIERFRMPTFFFISGWLFYKSGRIWNEKTIRSIIRKKFMVQIIPTAIFMLLYLMMFNLLDISSFGSDKKGYWFTIVLFEYFVIFFIDEFEFLGELGSHVLIKFFNDLLKSIGSFDQIVMLSLHEGVSLHEILVILYGININIAKFSD